MQPHHPSGRDNELSQFDPDTHMTITRRSIGGGHDESAPTDRSSCPQCFVNVRYRVPTDQRQEGEISSFSC